MDTQTDNIRKELLKECNELAHSPCIPDLLEREIRKQGFAGPADVPKLVYSALFTGMLRRPVSLLIKGPSGAGKSFSVRMAKQFIPSECYVAFEGMSEKAIVYLEGLNLKHKHLIIGEASGIGDGEGRTLLRQLLSEDIVRYATVQSTSQGHKGTELPPLEGPCGLIMTTTATGIHHEDENRMLSVNILESPEQIAEALMAQATGTQASEVELDTTAWFALQRYVAAGPKEVFIPFARDIVKWLPRTHDRIKRDFPQVLSLITASALMHSCTRDRTKDGAVIAKEDDYALVHSLVNGPISEGLQSSVPEPVRVLVETVRQSATKGVLPGEDRGVGLGRLAELLKRDLSVISRTAHKATKEGFLVDLNPGQGRPSRLVLGERELPVGSVLPDPKVLFASPERAVAV